MHILLDYNFPCCGLGRGVLGSERFSRFPSPHSLVGSDEFVPTVSRSSPLCYEQCPKNSFKRLYIVKGLLVSFSKEFRWEFQCGGEGVMKLNLSRVLEKIATPNVLSENAQGLWARTPFSERSERDRSVPHTSEIDRTVPHTYYISSNLWTFFEKRLLWWTNVLTWLQNRNIDPLRNTSCKLGLKTRESVSTIRSWIVITAPGNVNLPWYVLAYSLVALWPSTNWRASTF